MKRTVEVIQGKNSNAIYHLGPPLSDGPLPSVFYFAIAGDESLTLDPFNQFVQYLEDAPIRCFSLTLPGHGPDLKKENAIHFVADAFEKGEDLFEPFFESCLENIQYLIDSHLINPEKLAVSGLSRGGYFASLLALRDSRIQTIIAFAPITNISYLIPKAASYDLDRYIDGFTSKTLRFYIGNRDQRVSTDLCFQFIRQVADTAFEKGIRSPQAELIITSSIGHMGHGTAPSTFQDGANWLKTHFSPPHL